MQWKSLAVAVRLLIKAYREQRTHW